MRVSPRFIPCMVTSSSATPFPSAGSGCSAGAAGDSITGGAAGDPVLPRRSILITTTTTAARPTSTNHSTPLRHHGVGGAAGRGVALAEAGKGGNRTSFEAVSTFPGTFTVTVQGSGLPGRGHPPQSKTASNPPVTDSRIVS